MQQVTLAGIVKQLALKWININSCAKTFKIMILIYYPSLVNFSPIIILIIT